MPTWLDEWCIGTARGRRQAFTAANMPLDDACRHDGLAAKEVTLFAMDEVNRYYERGEEPSARTEQISFLAPYFYPPTEGEPNVAAFQIGNGLLVSLQDFSPTPALVIEIRQQLFGSISTYIDVPSGVVLVSEETELRAIFLEPAWIDLVDPKPGDPTSKQTLNICAVIARRGERLFRFANWFYDNVIATNRHPALDLIPAVEPEHPTFKEMLGMSTEDFKMRVEEIALYVLSQSRNPAMAVAAEIPYMAPDHERRASSTNKEVRERFTLFRRIKRLSPTRAADSKNNSERKKRQGGTWHLTRKIQVKEHSRKQPFGPREEGKTRKITIRTHPRGPDEGLPLHPLAKVG